MIGDIFKDNEVLVFVEERGYFILRVYVGINWCYFEGGFY